MTRRNKVLLAGYALALAGCGVIAFFDRVLIGAIGAGLSTFIFAMRYLAVRSDNHDEAREELGTIDIGTPAVGAIGSDEYVVYGAPPGSFLPGNPGYRPPDGHD